MKLLTKKIRDRLLDNHKAMIDPTDTELAVCKFFHPFSNWTWFAHSMDEYDICYGYVVGHYPEFGYFSIEELESVKVERDLYYYQETFKEIKARYTECEASKRRMVS